MCLNPVTLITGQQVACQKCWQCLRNKVDDWTGRLIAEGQVSSGAYVVTLTYGRDTLYNSVDHLKAATLTYSDIQKLLKLMRRHGLKVRYLIVGEYGAMKGRSHWHCVLFFRDFVPIMEIGKNTDYQYWPHGHTYWDRLTPEAIAYVAKYVAKEVEAEGAFYHMGMSRRPPLGDGYFRMLAQRYIEARLAPQDFVYQFAGVERKGKQRKFVMRGKTRENFLRYYRDGWWAAYGDHPPNSEILDKFEDDESRAGSQDHAKRVLAAEKAGMLSLRDSVPHEGLTRKGRKPKSSDLRPWMDRDRLYFSETLNVWLYAFDGKQSPWYWAMDDQGEWGWRGRIGARARNDMSASYLSRKCGG